MMAPLADPLAVDERSRRSAQSTFDHPVVVVAGAGTGKTALLVARVAAWCVGPGWERHAGAETDPQTVARRVIERVVAITFTEAAAAEMARKIGMAFLELAAGQPPVGWDPEPGVVTADDDELALRARALSEESHRLVVSTIHAFCQRLLATYPLEAGLHPRFEVDAEGERIGKLAEEAVVEALRGLETDPNRGSWEELAVDGVSPAQIVEALVELVEAGAGPGLFREDPFSDGTVVAARLRSSAEDFKCALGDRLDGVTAEVIAATRDVAGVLAAVTAEGAAVPSMDELEAAAAAVDSRVVGRLKEWSRLKFNKTEKGRLEGLEHQVAAASGRLAAVLGPLADLRREQLTAARAVVVPLLETVENRRSAAGLVTFSDLIRLAEALLANSPGVRREVVAGIDHLLVDEFQDTDDVQCRLVESLALTGDPERRPSLFIVGDPKQSIYAWRSADLAAYDSFVKKVVKSGGITVDLVRNFRSVTPILDEVERLVAPVMREEQGVQPSFQRLEATDERRGVPGVDEGRWKTVEHWVAWPRGDDGVAPEKGNSDRLTTALEAAALAADIRRLHDEAVISRWGDVAVLLRVTTSQEELLAAFREAGIPYEVARERDYYRQREVVEMAALVRCVLEATDTLALLTVLRSDVVGVPDAALAPLWDAGLPGRMARLTTPGSAAAAAVRACIESARSAVPSGLPGSDALPLWPAAVETAVEVIAELRLSLREDPPDVFVEKVRTLWLAEVTAAARYLGGFRRARVARFLADLEETLVAGEGGDAELARFLRLAVESGKESRVPVPPDLETDAVHVMTIHRAKGLDFEHVYVAQIHKGGRSGGDRKAAAVKNIGDGREYRLLDWSTPGYRAAEWEQTQKTRAELVRLLYVATTRAKKRLVVSGGWEEAGNEAPPESAVDFADLVGRRLDPGAVARQIDAEAERDDDEAAHVVRVMPVFAGSPGTVTAKPGGNGDWSLPEGALERAAELAGARRAAVERMARPVFRSASAEAHDRLRRAEAEETETAGEGAPDRHAAMALGTSVHSMMETLDLRAALAPQVAEHRARILADLETGGDGDGKKRLADDLLARLAEGSCLDRLEAIAGQVVARELPVLLWSKEPGAPGAVVSGIVDLVYCDPDDGHVVVADYKTDALPDQAAIDEKVLVYEPQVRAYARALREALDLDHEPHVEFWFLAADQIVRL
jgi:ATP-dependent helicase/nuclease subunit A